MDRSAAGRPALAWIYHGDATPSSCFRGTYATRASRFQITGCTTGLFSGGDISARLQYQHSLCFRHLSSRGAFCLPAERAVAIQLDCFVAPLLAMTFISSTDVGIQLQPNRWSPFCATAAARAVA